MLNGFWIVQYEGIAGNGGGVAVFLNGRVYGGDTGYLYEGHIQQDGEIVRASISVKNFLPEILSVLGTNDNFTLLVEGKMEGKVIKAKASVTGMAITGILLKLTRVSDVEL